MRWILMLLVCGFAVGCQNLQVQRPTAAVRGMTVKDINTSGFTMNFDVEVSNPNTVELPLANADYKLALGGVQVVDGKAKPEGSLPAKGSRNVAVPVTLTYENLLAAEKAIVKSGGNVDYALDAGLALDTGNKLFGDVRVPLQYKGTLPLKDVLNNPSIVLQSPAARKLAQQIMGSIFGR